MRIGLFTVLYNEFKLEKVLKLVSKLGYQTIGLAAWKGSNHLEYPKYFEWGSNTVQEND